MSATRPSRQRPPVDAREPAAPRDISLLHARRREARRKRRLLRVDVGVGLVLAIVLLIATPGLAIAALLAGLMLALCVGSAVVQRRRRRGPARSRTDRRRARTR